MRESERWRRAPWGGARARPRGCATHLQLPEAGVCLADALNLQAARLLLAARGLQLLGQRHLLRLLKGAAAGL